METHNQLAIINLQIQTIQEMTKQIPTSHGILSSQVKPTESSYYSFIRKFEVESTDLLLELVTRRKSIVEKMV